MKEIWKTIKNFENYQVSSLGRIKSLKRYRKHPFKGVQVVNEKILKQQIRQGYYFITLKQNKKKQLFMTHQLIAIAFLNHNPCGHKLVIDHINYNKLDNNVDNLQIITHRKNLSKDKFRKEKLSHYTGVTWFKRNKKWRALIYKSGKNIHLGYFKIEIDAHLAYQKALKNI